MKIILDECMPRKIGDLLNGHIVKTVGKMRWSSLKNGELLAKVAEQFDVFITVDNGIKYQQNIAKYEIAVVILRSRGSTFDALRPIVPALQEVLETITKGEVITISDRS